MGSARVRRMASNRLLLAAVAGALVWLADQPTVPGYQPLLEMFWKPGIADLPFRDGVVLFLSWFVTTLFCHLVVFTLERRPRGRQPEL